MAGFPVTGDQDRDIDRRMCEIKRQLRQPDGSPLDPVKVLKALQGIVEGDFDHVPVGRKVFINCDANPYIPNDWKVEEHRKGGEMEFDPTKVVFHLDEGQKNGRTIVGNELRKRFADKPVMNACVLDFLLANTNLIPEMWKANEDGSTRYIYFWGTVYRSSDGSLCVRYLCWRDGRWNWRYNWLDYEWDDRNSGAVFAS